MALGQPGARRQFRVLFHDFLARMVDLELLSSRGDIERLLGQFAAMLAALSFTLMANMTAIHLTSPLSSEQLAIRAWPQEEFLVAASMAIAGLLAVLAWNNVFPDRRDSLILGVLPVRARTLFLAKTAAIAAAVGVSVMAVNCFTGLSIPLLALPHAGALGLARSFLSYWAAMLAGGLFVCCGTLALQGIAAQLLSYRLFLRVSSFLQLAAFFTVLGGFFLKPSFPAPREMAAAQFQPWFQWMPSFWFFGLLQQLNGTADAPLAGLATRAVWALAIVCAAALATSALAYGRNIRRIVEQPDIAPSGRSRPAAWLGSWLAARWIARPVERAIVLFTARTLARSRQHRLLIAAYGGIGLAIALAYARELIYHPAAWVLAPQNTYWRQPNTPLMTGGLVLLVFAVLGARAVFALPLALPANWIFRVTAVDRPSRYFSAVSKSVWLLAAGPLFVAAGAAYLAIWPLRPALEHTAVLAAAAVLLVSRSLDGFQKIPFACSYLPGKANINIKLGVYALLFLLLADLGVRLEFWAMHSVVAVATLYAFLATAAVAAHYRWTQFAAAPGNRIQFEDLPVADVSPLDLHGSEGGAWTGGEVL
jgi:hypothetical protein